MKLVSRFAFFLLCLVCSVNGLAQTDSIQKLSLENFLQLVKQNHPLAKQANLILESAKANTLYARGSFDPKLFYEFKNKFYDSKDYYNLGNAGFSIPTWYGLEFKAGYQQNQGEYLNPQNVVPEQGLIYSQISISLLQGLLIDERRSTLRQAQIFQELSEFDKINAINELLFKAGKDYLEWYLTFTNLKVQQNAVDISKVRFDAIIRTASLGDRPSIDTVEANIQLQDRIINYQQALMTFRTRTLLLSNYLWLENDIPIELSDKIIPEPASLNYENENRLYTDIAQMDSLINLHPSLRIVDFKIKQLTIEKKFKQDKLKPNLDFNYNPLFDPNKLSIANQNNYQWGVTLGFPIFLRKERGDLQITKIKIQNTRFENSNKRNELLNKTRASINEYNNYKSQIEIFSKNVLNYERLWESEKRLFDAGESSLFMINNRELSFINAQIKLNEIINKNKKAALETEYSFGLLNTIY